MKTTVITQDDDLQRLVDQINNAVWDEANEMSTYDVANLQAYLKRQDTIFLVCHEDSKDELLLGFASSRIEIKPYGGELWLYVDEVDVCADQRQKGVGKTIMKALLDIAADRGCEEVWLGTEDDNMAANALYRSLDPDEEDKVVGYTFEVDE